MSFDPAALARIIENGSVTYRQNAVSYIFECNRCNSASKLYIRKRDGIFCCWKCKETSSYKGKAEWALRELYDIPLDEIRTRLYGTELPSQLEELVIVFDDIWGEEDDDEVSAAPSAKEMEWPPDFYTFDDGLPFLNGAKYLHSRGVNIEHVRTYDIRYSPAEKRVIFPVKVGGKLVGYQARYTGPTEVYDPKTGNSRRIPKILTSKSLRDTGSRYLMFQDRLIGSPHCVLAEGPISAIKAHLCGGNVASMGKAVSKNQLATIASYGVKKLYLALDPDAAAEITRLVNDDLTSDMELYLLMPPKGRADLGDATQEEVLQQFNAAPRIDSNTLMVSLGGNLAY